MLRRFDFGVSQSNGPMLGLVGLLLAGVVAGIIVGMLWTRVSQDGLREDDYLVMVSLLYDRERSVPNAQERLAVLADGDVIKNLATVAETYPKAHPEAQVEARALRQLANTLAKSPADTKPQKTNSDRNSEGGSGGIWIWLGVALVFVLALGIGGPFALRFAHANQRRFELPWKQGPRRGGVRFEPRTIKRPPPQLSQMRTFQRPPTSVVEESKPIWQESKQEINSVSKTPGLRFSSRYEFGEDPFDEVHPVMDKITGELIGACGVSAELRLSDEFPGRYYAFSVWAHDYAGGHRLQAIGVVSRWAKSKPPVELVKWTESGKATDIVVANPGMRLFIDTANLAVDVNIANFRYGADAGAPQDSYFSSLVINFDVKVKNLAEA